MERDAEESEASRRAKRRGEDELKEKEMGTGV